MSWMRVVVTRLETDRWRATRRMEPLDEPRDRNPNGGTESPDPDRAKLLAASSDSYVQLSMRSRPTTACDSHMTMCKT